MLGKLFHYAADAILISAILAGIKRSTVSLTQRAVVSQGRESERGRYLWEPSANIALPYIQCCYPTIGIDVSFPRTMSNNGLIMQHGTQEKVRVEMPRHSRERHLLFHIFI